MLTKKQLELLMLIDQRIQATGVPPSFDEMKVEMSLKSKSGIHRLIMALEERGYIRRLPHRARALEVVKRPERAPQAAERAAAPAPAATAAKSPRVAALEALIRRPAQALSGLIDVEMLGVIPAGATHAVEGVGKGRGDHETSIQAPAFMLSGPGPFYALRVKGDSMVEAGINDNDIALIAGSETAETGHIVAALVDDAEVTLKRLRRPRGAMGPIALEPANGAYKTQIYNPDRVKIQGRLIGLLRVY